MSYSAKTILDSESACGVRLTTMELTYPRFVHSELLTHRAFSRSSASSRAIPLAKMLQQVNEDPVIPIRWGSEARGMQQGAELDAPERVVCQCEWLAARDMAVAQARSLGEQGLHKSLCNRLVEPYMWITVIVSATDWQNFFRLRCHPDAEPHIEKIAQMAREVYDRTTPTRVPAGEWHRPFMPDLEEITEEIMVAQGQGDIPDSCPDTLEIALNAISAARVARVSYLTHDGKRDWRKDLDLAYKLRRGSGFGHWAPTEHAAQSLDYEEPRRIPVSGNFRGWKQYRKTFSNECAKETR